MYLLGINTTNNYYSVALSRGQTILSSIHVHYSSVTDSSLNALISKVLATKKIAYENLHYLAVTQGPGSFTGIRVGLSTALAINMSIGLPVVTISNLELLKFITVEQVKDVEYAISIINAYSNKLYFQQFSLNHSSVFEPALLDASNAMEQIEKLSMSDKKVACSGNGLEILYPYYKKLKKTKNIIFLPRFANHDARAVCKLAYEQILNNTYTSHMVPLYIKAPDTTVTKK